MLVGAILTFTTFTPLVLACILGGQHTGLAEL